MRLMPTKGLERGLSGPANAWCKNDFQVFVWAGCLSICSFVSLIDPISRLIAFPIPMLLLKI